MKKNKKKKIKNNQQIPTFLYYFILIYFMEVAFKFLIYPKIFTLNLITIVIFTIPIALLLTLLSRIFTVKINKVLTWIFTSLILFIYIDQYVFYTVFTVPFSFTSLGVASNALGFLDILAKLISNYILGIILLLLPIIFLVILNIKKNLNYEKYPKSFIWTNIGLIIILQLATYLTLLPNKKDLYSNYNLYFNLSAETKIIDKFGLLTGMRIDFKKYLFGNDEKIVIEIPEEEPNEEKPQETEYNIIDIDFAKLIASEKNNKVKELSSYFNNQKASNKNEYTGIFKDKNLIFIMAEGFNEIAVQKDITPTLYKLTHEGFNFNNFYSPAFFSTTGGEFQATTGLIPSQEVIGLWKEKTPTFNYALGNAFNKINYNVNAYHDWNYRFYRRDLTMPTLGYENYIGCGNGLEKLMNCKNWTPSDIDMINVTTSDFLPSDVPFLTYYFTVSGHSNYNWTGQRMAIKNKNLVANLPYSETAKAYLATQIELDKALELLIQKLEESQELADTVIALVGDHYPYSMSVNEINELSNYQKDKLFEVHHSNFIIWNSEQEPVTIDKYGSQIDVLPTLLNLFGIEYDSRLIIGKDILSTNEGIVVFSNRSWITAKGRYNAGSEKFISNSKASVSNKYIDKINTEVANKFSVSKLIVETDYYQKVLK